MHRPLLYFFFLYSSLITFLEIYFWTIASLVLEALHVVREGKHIVSRQGWRFAVVNPVYRCILGNRNALVQKVAGCETKFKLVTLAEILLYRYIQDVHVGIVGELVVQILAVLIVCFQVGATEHLPLD